jgi:hypothetical protein
MKLDKNDYFHHKAILFLLIAAFLSSCGGSGDSNTPVEYTQLDPSIQETMSGDWPESEIYYLIKDDVNLNFAWNKRQASLDCSLERNKVACNASKPPKIDFQKYNLIGIYLGSKGDIGTYPDGRIRVHRSDSGIIIEFAFMPLTNSFISKDGIFYLIPATSEDVTFTPTL